MRSPLKAIRQNCIECSGDSRREVELCQISDCPLWAYRFGKRPGTAARAGKATGVAATPAKQNASGKPIWLRLASSAAKVSTVVLACVLALASGLSAAELTTQPAAIVRAPSAGTWTVIAADLSIVPANTQDGGRSILVTGEGRYRVLWVGGGQTITAIVPVGGASPTPPGPTPKPDVQPQPMPDVVPAPVGKLFVCVIEETAEPPADVDMPGIRSSKPIREYVAVQGWDLRIVDKDVKDAAGNPPAELASYLDRAKGQALPWVVAADSKGTLAIDQRCPANAAALLDLLKKYGGVK